MSGFRCKDLAFKRLLASTPTGAVFLGGLNDAAAAHPFPSKEYTIKCALNADAGPGAAGPSFLNEFGVLRGLGPHPRILRLLCVFEDALPPAALALMPAENRALVGTSGPVRFGVFEHLSRTLAELRLGGPPVLPFADLLPIARQLASAQLHLDAASVVHRSLTLDKIGIAESGVVVAGFEHALQLATVSVFNELECCFDTSVCKT